MTEALWIMGRTVLALGVGVFLLFYFLQRGMMYFPAVEGDAELLRRAEIEELLPWTDSGGNRIGWMTAGSKNPEVVFLVFHGNAGNASHRAELARMLVKAAGRHDTRVLILEYPGFGARPGKPSQPSMTRAGLEAREIASVLFPKSRIILVGESIGSGVAAQVAASSPPPPPGLLLITPFDRIETAARRHYPWLPVGLLLRDRWESDRVLRGYPGRVVLLLAGDDEVVPVESGRALAAGLDPGRTMVVEEPGAGHNDVLFSISPRNLSRAVRFAAGFPE